jgi:hypothetical protein
MSMGGVLARESSRENWWRWLAWSFLAGAVADLAFGLGILLMAERLAPILRVEIPVGTTRVYFDLCGLFLVALGGLYLMIFAWPKRLAPVAAWATLLRVGGFTLFAGAAFSGRASASFWYFAQIDACFGFAHLILIRLAAGGLLPVLRGKVG